MKKQEIIKQAYGEHWDKVCEYVDEKGWCVGYWNICELLNGISKPRSQGTKWRPKSIEGLEDNNGWEEIFIDGKIPNINCWLIDNKGNIIFSAMDEYIPKEHNYTHYQRAIRPEPPLY